MLIYILPLLFDTPGGELEIVWLIYLVPVLITTYYSGLRGGIVTALLSTLIHMGWEFRERYFFDHMYDHRNFLTMAFVDCAVFAVAIGLGLMVEKLRSEKGLRIEKEKELQATTWELETTLDSMSDGLFFLDKNLRLVYVNKNARKVLSAMVDNYIGKSLLEIQDRISFEPEFLLGCQKALRTQEPSIFEFYTKLVGRWLEVRVYPSHKGLTAIFRDISELKRIQTEMARLDRLNLIGVMAAGLGHEIRNPLTTVRGFLQLLGEAERFSDVRDRFDLMISELDQANSIITEFLSLAKTKATDVEQHNLNEIIKRLQHLFSANAICKDKTVILELNEIPNLMVNEKEIRQLVLNLVSNGLEAMPDSGVLTVRTCLENDKVILSVQDQGQGIPSENMQKLGTPFWTTKDYGTGLGLAVCYGIAERHNAVIEVDTSSEGTTFHVRFQMSAQPIYRSA
jgi:two-component system, sporulation sensor kinase E